MLPMTATIAKPSPMNQQPRLRNRQLMMMTRKRNKLRIKPMEKINFSTFEHAIQLMHFILAVHT